MKKYFAGLLTGLLAVGVITTALAATDLVSFNLSPITFNGEIISAAGEGYTLSNGCVAPASITYTDERGGGTTYLPARRVSELMGVDIGWDPATGAVTIGKASDTTTVTDPDAKPEHPTTPDTTASANDYSDWSAEDEAEYQEFKGMWTVKYIGTTSYSNTPLIDMRCDQTEKELEKFMLQKSADTIEKYCLRIDGELLEQYGEANVMYHFMKWGEWGWQDTIANDHIKCSYKTFYANRSRM